MTEICDILVLRLSAERLTHVEIFRIIKDVFAIMRNDESFSVDSVNKRLKGLGWGKRIIDERTLQLITFLLENDFEYELQKHCPPYIYKKNVIQRCPNQNYWRPTGKRVSDWFVGAIR